MDNSISTVEQGPSYFYAIWLFKVKFSQLIVPEATKKLLDSSSAHGRSSRKESLRCPTARTAILDRGFVAGAFKVLRSVSPAIFNSLNLDHFKTIVVKFCVTVWLFMIKSFFCLSLC